MEIPEKELIGKRICKVETLCSKLYHDEDEALKLYFDDATHVIIQPRHKMLYSGKSEDEYGCYVRLIDENEHNYRDDDYEYHPKLIDDDAQNVVAAKN